MKGLDAIQKVNEVASEAEVIVGRVSASITADLTKIVNLFCGAGGWDVALRKLGHEAVGIDISKDACATREMAGLGKTINADIIKISPPSILEDETERCVGLIASPPCQSFSIAGNMRGTDDPRGQLIFEIMRWAIALGPDWIVCENVPQAMHIFRQFAEHLFARGYTVFTDVLHAEAFGVPQSRTRAILIAKKLATSSLRPVPTHSRYYPHEPDRMDVGVLPWRTMRSTIPLTKDLVLRMTRGSGMIERHGSRPDRSILGPAYCITGKARSWTWHGEKDFTRRVEIGEAALLQTFPADYPWQG